MNFKQFLYEDDLPPHVKKGWAVDNDASRKHALEWILLNAKYALEHNNLIFRGFSTPPSQDISFIDASQGERKSKDTNNVYQIMMDNSMFMKDYPSRSKSLICTNDFDTADEFGTRYVIFPRRQQIIAVADKSDLLFKRVEGNAKTSFGSRTVKDFSHKIGILFSQYLSLGIEDMTSASLNHAMSEMSPNGFDNFLQALLVHDIEAGIKQIEKYISVGMSRFDAICSFFMSPESLGLETYKYNVDSISSYSERELWFSGRALVISLAAMKELLPDIEYSGVNISHNIQILFNGMRL